jgi:hypothetical protein
MTEIHEPECEYANAEQVCICGLLQVAYARGLHEAVSRVERYWWSNLRPRVSTRIKDSICNAIEPENLGWSMVGRTMVRGK